MAEQILDEASKHLQLFIESTMNKPDKRVRKFANTSIIAALVEKKMLMKHGPEFLKGDVELTSDVMF